MALMLSFFASATAALSFPLCASAAPSPVVRWGSFGTSGGAQRPTAVGGLSNVTAVDASNASAYALESDGSVWAWGNNRAGQLGLEAQEIEASPNEAVEVPLPAGVQAKAIGEAEFRGHRDRHDRARLGLGRLRPDGLHGQVRRL